MALTKVINDLADLNQSGSTNALKGCAGTTAQQPAIDASVDYLIVGGGGGGGWSGGGAGAGGLLTGSTTVYSGTPTVLTIGEGGNGIVATTPSNSSNLVSNGDDSGFNGIRAIGGGTGGSWYSGTGWQDAGKDGGSGGGGASTGYSATGGNGTTGQGLGGGDNFNSSAGWGAGGGGGAGTTVGNADGVGLNGSATPAGNGGSGRDMQSFINNTNANLAKIGDVSGSNVWFAGGGGGGIQDQSPVSVTGGTGGNGGGADGSNSDVTPTAAKVNTGGGAGGGGQIKVGGVWSQGSGGDGGSGVVALKYDNTEITGYSLNSGDTVNVNWPAGTFGRGYWPLNLNVKDIGGNYDGTATDITYATGKFNQAASFNGTSSTIELGSGDIGLTFGGSAAYSVSFWFKTSTISTWMRLFNFCGVGGDQSNQLAVSIYLSKLELLRRTGTTTTTSIEFTPVLSSDVWYHVVITQSGATSTVYINGISQTLTSGSTTTISSYSNIIFGSQGYSPYYSGLLEQIRIYGSVLTADNVTDIYNNSKPGTLLPLKTASDITTSTCNFPSGVTGTALYQFEGNANDTCGSFDATWTGTPAYGVGKFGSQCFSGDGSTSRVVNSSLTGVTGNAARTYNVWGYTNGSTIGALMCTGSWGLGGRSMALYIDQTYSPPRFKAYAYTASYDTDLGVLPTLSNGWHMFSLSWDGVDQYKAYIDGALFSTTTRNVTFNTTGYLCVGDWYDASVGNYHWNSLIDQARLYAGVLTDENIYNLWQENEIQTYFPNTPASGTDTLVFKSGSGEISFTNDTAPGAEVGMLRYNSTLGKMEHFNSSGWKSLSKVINFVTVNYLIVAGGGGGAEGGGGAGGLRTSWPGGSGGGANSEDPVELFLATNYNITVGTGGSGGPSTVNGGEIGTSGNPSSVDTIISLGGGRGGGSNPTSAGALGGSGGGGKRDNSSLGGDGTLNQGYAGGPSTAPGGPPWWIGGGGGGGASAAGAAGSGGSSASEAGGNGGDGLPVDITGAYVTYAGGGGGGCEGSSGNGGSGGSGGGGNGGGVSASVPGAGSANTGSGGGGTSKNSNNAGDGGSGIVILRYPNTYTLTNNSTATLTTGVINQAVGTDKYTTFTAGTGNISFS